MFCQNCGKEILEKKKFCINCGANIEAIINGEAEVLAPVQTVAAIAGTSAVSGQTKAASAQTTDGPVKAIADSLEFLKNKISKNGAFLGVVIGFAVFAFSLFLTWSSIPAGSLARDGGASSGWRELAFLAVIPLVVALYPVLLQRAVGIKMVLINIVISFILLGYNNVINRSTWINGFGYNMGSDLGIGFLLGLIAITIISLCGIAWSLHTRSSATNDA